MLVLASRLLASRLLASAPTVQFDGMAATCLGDIVKANGDGDECRVGAGSAPASINTLEGLDMTATYTFDVFSSLDGFGAASGDWTGYWGKQGPELLDHRLALYGAEQRMVRGQYVSGLRADAGFEYRGV